jgi:rubrerythrin
VLRGTGEDEKLLKNAKTEYTSEAEEIATYTAIEVLAESVGDKDTAKLAKAIRREEERMQKYLGTLIPQLTRAVAKAEIPAAERKKTGSSSSRRRASASRSRSASRNGASASTARKSSAKRKSSTTRRKPATRKTAASRSRAKSRS